jgi:mono/diheme cytochrome c family protein
MQTHPPFTLDRPRVLTGTMLLALTVMLSPRAAAAAEGRGEQIYRRQCTACHGAAGEGTDDYPHALAGDRSVAQLARLIARTMPKDAPKDKKCTGADADQVAAYIYEAFYSKAARDRARPPRIELSRLTVQQYRNAVADPIGTFREPVRWDDQRGLQGEYFKSRRFRPNERVLERLDPAVEFDFGTAAPDPEKFDANQFSIRWTSSVLAPETGEYEFVIRTEHAARLWVNDLNRPLIDAWVKSGNDTEYRATIFLLAGRVYPLRLEFSKAKQGVDDSKNNKDKPAVKASVALLWKLPQQAAEVIPERNLSPNQPPELFVLTTPFPPDDRSIGYERGTSVSKAWDQATTDAAIEVAGYVTSHLRDLSGVAESASDREVRLREFCRRFAERAFRRPLTEAQQQLYVHRQFDAAGDLETAVRRVVLFVLKSPHFLYRERNGGADAYDVASRLSFGLWDSLPDQELLDAAAAGRLTTREQVERQAERMLSDPRTHTKLRSLFFQWLKADPVPEVAKDLARFPEFDPVLVADLRTSLDLFLEDVLWSDASDFRQLLLADYLYLNGRLARFYGADLPADAPFQKVALDPGERAGVLSHPYLMARFAYTATSSPIHRGVFVARSVLGRMLQPPPAAFTPLAPELHPDLTTRERVALQTKEQSCLACHSMLNPLGFTLEHFDAVGRFRDKENGKPIDATGAYQTRKGQAVQFSGGRDLAKFLADSEETHDAFVEQLFHHLVKQPVRAYGPQAHAELRQFFEEHDCNVRKLMVEIMAATALTRREFP